MIREPGADPLNLPAWRKGSTHGSVDLGWAEHEQPSDLTLSVAALVLLPSGFWDVRSGRWDENPCHDSRCPCTDHVACGCVGDTMGWNHDSGTSIPGMVSFPLRFCLTCSMVAMEAEVN